MSTQTNILKKHVFGNQRYFYGRKGKNEQDAFILAKVLFDCRYTNNFINKKSITSIFLMHEVKCITENTGLRKRTYQIAESGRHIFNYKLEVSRSAISLVRFPTYF